MTTERPTRAIPRNAAPMMTGSMRRNFNASRIVGAPFGGMPDYGIGRRIFDEVAFDLQLEIIISGRRHEFLDYDITFRGSGIDRFHGNDLRLLGGVVLLFLALAALLGALADTAFLFETVDFFLFKLGQLVAFDTFVELGCKVIDTSSAPSRGMSRTGRAFTMRV